MTGHPRPAGEALLVRLLMLLCLSATARAGCPEPAGGDAHQHLARGDVAWLEGRRGEARCAWRAAIDAAEQADAAPDAATGRALAVRAMAELRRLRTSGNLGLAVQGPRADRAIAACPVDLPWCRLARADRALLVTELGIADERARAVSLAASVAQDGQLPVAAAVRAAQAGALPLPDLQLLADAPGLADQPDIDIARALVATQGGRPSPGSWALGLGFVGAPGMGAGPVVRLTHPDVGWRGWKLEAEGLVTSAGAARLAAGLRTAGPTWLTTGAAASRLLVPVYDADGTLVARDEVLSLSLRGAPGITRGAVSAWLGPALRLDQSAATVAAGEPGMVHGHGLFGGVGAGVGRRLRLRTVLDGELAVAGPRHLDLGLDVVFDHPAPLRARLAWQAVGSLAPLATSPTWRMPAWGGGVVLRSAPLGRFREPAMAAGVVEWRQPLVGVLGAAAFGEVALAEGLHLGGGGGLRLHLPPRPRTTVRLDLAGGSEGLALTAGYGEAF